MKLRKKLTMLALVAVFAVLTVVGVTVSCRRQSKDVTVTITFVTNGGNELAPVTLKQGEELTLPQAQKEGLVFSGWYFDTKFENSCSDKITVQKDETLYARYCAILTFDSSGGTEVAPRTYYEGEEIGVLPASYKNGFSFGGWYYDENRKNIVGKKDCIGTSVTVYAEFSATAETLRKLTSVRNVSVAPTVEVIADDVVLHNGNVSDYISFTSSGGEELGLVCSPSGGTMFIVEPNVKLDEGATYYFKSLSSAIKFAAVDGNDAERADEVTVTTSKEEKEVISKKPTVHIAAEELAKWEENVYVYMDSGLEKDVNRIVAKTNKEIKTGSIVTIGETTEEKDDDYICKVIAVRRERMQYVVGTELKEDDFVVMEVVTPNVDDIYYDIDIYGERQAQIEGNISLSAETVAENVERNEGVVMLKNAVRNAVINSPTVIGYMESLPTETEKVEFMAALGGFNFQKPKVKIDIRGTSLAFEIELGGEIQVKNFKVGVTVTISNRTQVDYRYTICKSRLVTLNPLLWFYTDVKVDFSNDFSIALAATVEFADSDDDIHGVIDITDEVEYIIDVGKDGQNKFAEAITGSPLWEDDGELEYVDIFSIPLGQIPLPVPIVSLQLDFNVVGSLGARAGLYVEFSHHYVETTTLTNGESASGANGKPVMFKEFKFTRATTENEIGIDITLKGQVGFRCGLEVKLSLSVARLNNVAAVYVSFRFGPYIELSGLVSFSYSYDAVNKVSETHLYGGMYLEVGLFVNAKIGAKFLVYDLNTDIFDKKISLYGVGDRLIPLDFVEKINSPDDPYVITSRYGGVRMIHAQMEYLDIVTGENVVDNAKRNMYGSTLDYEFEFYDVPDYQTENYKDYIIINGDSTLISKRYPFKTLRFAVKAKLLPRHGVYASGIERIFYVEYRNPDGRDYAEQNSEFRNEYYVGGGSTYSEVLARYTFREGEQVSPPEFTRDTLPVRQGYYLDVNDLWEKYYPFLGGRVDENFNGVFPKVTYENATEMHGYIIVNTCYYRLKWKQRTFTADFYYPEYSSAEVISDNVRITSAQMIYVPSLRSFIVLTDKITAPDIEGKKYETFFSSCGLTYTNEYYTVDPKHDAFNGIDIEAGLYPIIRVDEQSKLFTENFDGINNGAAFYATYTDANVFTETYVLEAESLKRVKAEYKPFDYVGKAIRPVPPAEFKIGAEFTAYGNTYVITGYRDINPEDESSSRYFSEDSMPDVTRNRIYYLLYERKGFSELPVYYVNIVANGKHIGDYGVKEGEPINVAVLKINFDDKTVIGKLAGYPSSRIDDVIENYTVEWNDSAIPSRMPKKDITVTLTATYSFNELAAEFIVSNPLQSFADGIVAEERPNGDRVYTARGKTWTFGINDDAAFYSLPRLNDYFDNDGKKYYSFYGWENTAGEELPYGIRLAFIGNAKYTPLFVEKEVFPTIALVSVGDYGYEYYYKIVEGDYFGKTLKEFISAEKITDPVRGDVNGIYEYEFNGWGVDAETYVIGEEKDINGNVKTYILFKAQFTEKGKRHTITFDALGGKFASGESVLKKTGVYGEDISGIVPENYSDEKGEFTFICWTTLPYSPEHRVDENELRIGNSDVTYYAYYSLSPATITLTFKGKAETERTDGTGIVYFGGDKTRTELTVSGLYGRTYYITANDFAVDSPSESFVPDYLRWTVDGKEYISAFYNDGYMAEVPFDHNATIEIIFKKGTPKIINIAFVSDGECFELDGSKIDGVICNGYMSGLRHVVNYYEAYGTKIAAPFVDYYSEHYYRFDRWETKPTDGSTPVSFRAGDEITFTEDTVFYGVYVHDTTEKVVLTFCSESYYGVPGAGDLVGLQIFPDGSVEITDCGVAGEKITFDILPSCKGMTFVGWTVNGNDDFITQSQLNESVYSSKATYYAVYEAAADKFDIVVRAGDGKFGDGKTEKTITAVSYGKLASELERPAPNADGLVFSHYENADGYPVTAVEKTETLYAKYAKPVSTFEDLRNINLAPEENYVLTNDISVGGYIFDENSAAEWTAIGSNSRNGFSGTFNGNGYKINISAKSGTKQNFGFFAKVGGTVYNLSVVGYFSIKGSTDATALGAFCGEISASGRVIDCQSFTRFEVAVSASRNVSVSGSIGVNNGIIDGLMASASGTIEIDSDKEFTVGAAVGTNNGAVKNVNQSGRGGALYVSLARSLNCNVGSFAGCNTGVIENSFSERAVMINLSQGDNVYLEKSVIVGGFVGRNDGTIRNATTLYGILEYDISNVTLLGESGLEIAYYPYDENSRFIVYAVGKDEQGVTHTTRFVIYLDDDAKKVGSTEYREYTLSEFIAENPADGKKFMALIKAIAFGSFVSADNGKTDNCAVIDRIGTGNGVELVSSCGFDEIKWNYISRLHDTVYEP